MDPINYSTDVATPFQAALAGYQGGAAIRNDQMQQQQQQLALQQQQMQQKALSSLVNNPNAGADEYSRVMTLIPSLSEPLKKAWEAKSTGQKDVALSNLSQWSSAIQNGRPDVASAAMRARADALDSATGTPGQDSIALRHQADAVDAHPAFANAVYIKPMLMAHPDGKRLVDNIAAMGVEGRAADMAPAALKKATADASTAASDSTIKGAQAAVAPVTTALGNQKTAQEIAKSKVDADVAQFNSQIASANSETERGRLTLERDKYIQEQAKLQQTQGIAAQEGMDSLNNAMQSVADIKTHRGMDAFFTGPGTKWGAVWRVAPGSDRQALETYIDTLKSQLGFGALMAAKAASPTGASGFGALSESELKVISQQAGDLNPNSSDFPQQLAKIERYLQKAQAKAVAGPTLPTKGGGYVATVPGIGVVDEGHINHVLKANPGSTRDQVIKFLQSVGGK